MKPDPSSTFAMGMHANLDALADQLTYAATLAREARDAMNANNRNLAIGTVLSLERTLPECVTVLRSLFALQSWHNNLPTLEGGGR